MSYERHKKAVAGPESAVPCPWCNHRNDHRPIKDLGGRETGTVVECDNEDCRNKYTIERVDIQPRIVVKQFHKDPEDLSTVPGNE